MAQDNATMTDAERHRSSRRERFDMLRHIQEIEGLSGAGWAEKSCLPQSGISQYSTGYATPSDDALAKLAEGLGLPRGMASDLPALGKLAIAAGLSTLHPPLLQRFRSALSLAGEVFGLATDTIPPDQATIDRLLESAKDCLPMILSFERPGESGPETPRMRQRQAELEQFRSAMLAVWRAFYTADKKDGRTAKTRLFAGIRVITETHYQSLKTVLGRTDDLPHGVVWVAIMFLQLLGEPPAEAEAVS